MRSLEEIYNGLLTNPFFEYFSIKKAYERRNLTEDELKVLYKEEMALREGKMNRYENPFMHILHFSDEYFDCFAKEDEIVIQEKIDGSNTHFVTNGVDFTAYGNNFILNEVNDLQGYYFWVEKEYKKVLSKYYGLEIYGEWLVPHHCEYPFECYGKFYVFDVMENGEYWPQYKVEELTRECGFLYAPILYRGPFISWKHIMEFVGTTKLGGEKGEGVVVKNQTTLNSKSKPFYAKVVDVEFQETNNARTKVITIDMKKILEKEKQKEMVENVVTLARVRKILLKEIDNGNLNPNWKQMDDRYTYNIIRPLVYKDCMKETKEVMDYVGKAFPMYLNKNVEKHIKDLKIE